MPLLDARPGVYGQQEGHSAESEIPHDGHDGVTISTFASLLCFFSSTSIGSSPLSEFAPDLYFSILRFCAKPPFLMSQGGGFNYPFFFCSIGRLQALEWLLCVNREGIVDTHGMASAFGILEMG
jgi:hypothetical protein